jgi:hypothetical protein
MEAVRNQRAAWSMTDDRSAGCTTIEVCEKARAAEPAGAGRPNDGDGGLSPKRFFNGGYHS